MIRRREETPLRGLFFPICQGPTGPLCLSALPVSLPLGFEFTTTINDDKSGNCCYLLNAHCVPGTVLSNIPWMISCNHCDSLATSSPFTDEETGLREKE